MFNRWFRRSPRFDNTIMGINERNVRMIYPNNHRSNYKFADDKILAKQLLEQHGLACPVTYATISRIGDIETVWRSLNHQHHLVIKPAKGRGGGGILVLTKTETGWKQGAQIWAESQIFSHMANIMFGVFSFGDSDRVIIEKKITPHTDLLALFDKGVADIRIIMLHGQPVMAMLRLPTSTSKGKANLHQGGLGVGICMHTGTLTYAYNGSSYTSFHPDSKAPIRGTQLPEWNSILTLSKAVSQVFPLKYMGIDIVIDAHEGPMVLEVNVRPGLGIQMANHKSLKEVI
ncbi:MAG: sugar-transfer associated ATP-grasp domain-containing protein [Bacteroidota bacterium]